MAHSVWQATIVDDDGDVLPAASVEVRALPGLTLATLYEDVDGNTPLANPFAADAEGFARFYVAAGRYRITATSGATSRTWDQVLLGMPSTEMSLAAVSVLGRAINSAGATGAIAAAANGTVLQRLDDALVFAKVAYASIADASSLSVLGRASNSSGVLADIQAGTDNQVLRRSGTSIAFGAVNLASSAAVTGDLPFANIAQITGPAVLGVSSSSTADLAAISAGSDDRVLRRTSGALTFGQLTAGMFPNTVVPDAALSSNVPLLNAANTFTADQAISKSNAVLTLTATTGTVQTFLQSVNSTGGFVGTISNHPFTLYTNNAARIVLDAAGTLAGSSIIGVAFSDFARLSQSNTFTGSTNGQRRQTAANTSSGTSAYVDIEASNGTNVVALTMAGTGFTSSVLTGGPSGLLAAIRTKSAVPLAFGVNDTAALVIDTSRNFDFKAGTVTTSNSSASEVGYKGAPSTDISASTNTATSTAGTTIRLQGGSGQTYTLDSDPPEDSFVVIDNSSGNAWTIAASNNLTWAATGAVGNRTLANGGMAVALHQGNGNWKISGGGIS